MTINDVNLPDARGRCTRCGEKMHMVEGRGTFFVFCACQLKKAGEEDKGASDEYLQTIPAFAWAAYAIHWREGV